LEYTSIEDLAETITKLLYTELSKLEGVLSNIQSIKVTVEEYVGLKCFRCMELGLMPGST